MQFVNVRLEGKEVPGVIQGDEIILIGDAFEDLVELIEAGGSGLETVRSAISSGTGTRIPLAGAKLAAPITRFRRNILCTGWNYWAHFEEGIGKRGAHEVEKPEAPTFFSKSPDVVAGPYDDIPIDTALSQQWDYEAEIAVVIGRGGRSIPAEKANEHVFGYCLANDVSLRDVQRRHGGQWFKGKSIDGTMPLGPILVTADEIDLPKIKMECLLNDEVVQSAFASQMAFDVPALIAELSLGMTLHPGDVLLTGTPSGIGHARTPPLYLRPGDKVIVRATGVGQLENAMKEVDLTAYLRSE